MPNEIQTAKAALRAEVRARLRAMSEERIVSASKTICARLRALPCWSAAHRVLLFASLPQEPDLSDCVSEALATTKTVALPRFSPSTQTYAAVRIRDWRTDLTLGKFNVREPRLACEEAALDQFDLILVPGMAFDLRGGRLGRGGGFYDRLLVETRGLKCGVAFDEQIVAEVPIEPQDVRMAALLTPSRWVELKN